MRQTGKKSKQSACRPSDPMSRSPKGKTYPKISKMRSVWAENEYFDLIWPVAWLSEASEMTVRTRSGPRQAPTTDLSTKELGPITPVMGPALDRWLAGFSSQLYVIRMLDGTSVATATTCCQMRNQSVLDIRRGAQVMLFEPLCLT